MSQIQVQPQKIEKMHRVVNEEVHHAAKQNYMQPITSEEEQAM